MQAGDCVYVIKDGEVVEAKMMEKIHAGWTTLEIGKRLLQWRDSDLHPNKAAAEVALRERQGGVEPETTIDQIGLICPFLTISGALLDKAAWPCEGADCGLWESQQQACSFLVLAQKAVADMNASDREGDRG